MKLPRFIRLPEYNRFEYKPIYFDERKQNLENKVKKFKEQKDAEEKGTYKPEIKGKFKSNYSRNITKKQKKAANLRLTVIIAFFGIIAYIILQRAEVLSYMFDVLFSG